MVIDHINTILLAGTRPEMFLIGRAAFPLFCYALAAGMARLAAEKTLRYALTRYAPRLLLLAIVTEPVAQFSRDIGPMGNVLFTLGLGAIMAGLCLRLKEWQVAALSIAAIALMYFPPPIEFSAAGVMLPSAFLLALRGRRTGYVCLIALLCVINLGDFANLLDGGTSVLMFVIFTALACTIPPLAIIRAVASLPQDGRYLPKYFLHVFYPAHLFAIWAAGRYLFHI